MLVACIAGLTRMVNAVDVNAWSLAYVSRAVGGSSEAADIGDPSDAHARARLWLAQAALEAGDPGRALTLLEPFRSTTDPSELDLIARALEANGDFAGAVAVWERVGNGRALLGIASRAANERRLEAALAAYQTAFVIDAEGGALPLANFLQWSMRDPVGAEEVLNEVLTLFPSSANTPTWLARLGDVLRAQERWEEALAFYQQALTTHDGSASAHIGLGWVYYEAMGDAQAAEAEFSRAIELAPNQGDGYAAIGDLRSRQQFYTEAEAWYVRALERNPNSRWWQLARANAVRAAGDLGRAAEMYEDVVAEFTDFGEAYFELAMTYDSLGEPIRAARSMDEATAKMTAPIAWHFDQAGRVYAAVGEWTRAVEAYRRALDLDPFDSAAIEGYGEAEAMLAATGAAP